VREWLGARSRAAVQTGDGSLVDALVVLLVCVGIGVVLTSPRYQPPVFKRMAPRMRRSRTPAMMYRTVNGHSRWARRNAWDRPKHGGLPFRR
jgi:hypothetical protein